MRIHNLYVDAQGESHFRDTEIASVRRSATTISLGILPRAGSTSSIFMLASSDGEKRVIGAGEVILAEDVTGKGHLSKAVSGEIRHSIFVPID